MLNSRYSDRKAKAYHRASVILAKSQDELEPEARGESERNGTSVEVPGDENVEQTYIYAREGEDPSPMYEGLRTNLPHDLMQYRGFPFPADTPEFPDRGEW